MLDSAVSGAPGRARMGARVGPPGRGARVLAAAGEGVALAGPLARVGIAGEGRRTFDGLARAPERVVVRDVDAGDLCVGACGFDARERYRGEARVHVPGWVGEAFGGRPPGGGLGWTWT